MGSRVVIPFSETSITYLLDMKYTSYAMSGTDADCNTVLDTEYSIRIEYEHSLHAVGTPHV